MAEPDRQGLAAEFEDAMREGVRTLAALGYHATRFEQMVDRNGGVEAARRLVDGNISDGLVTLRRMGRLDMSVELWVLFPHFRPLFDQPTRDKARRKLRQLGVDVEQALQHHPDPRAREDLT